MNPLNLFSNETDTQHYETGQTIFAEDSPGKYLYIIREGEVELSVNGVIVDVVGKGSIIGEMALIDKSARSATAKANNQCELIPVDEKRFLFLVSETPFFSIHVMKILADRIRKINALIGNV